MNPSVADMIAWDLWSAELKRIARAGVFEETEAQRDDIRADEREDARQLAHRRLDQWEAWIRAQTAIMIDQFERARNRELGTIERGRAARKVEELLKEMLTYKFTVEL